MTAIEKRFRNVPEVNPDETDLAMIESIKKANDTSLSVSLEDMDNIRAIQEYTGKISLRVPKMLHKELAEDARENGVSLNQFIVYKLARP